MTGCATQRRQLPRSSTCALTWNFAGSIRAAAEAHGINHTDRQYYSADGYPLRDGLRVAIGEHE